jgi:hypothetical protein
MKRPFHKDLTINFHGNNSKVQNKCIYKIISIRNLIEKFNLAHAWEHMLLPPEKNISKH